MRLSRAPRPDAGVTATGRLYRIAGQMNKQQPGRTAAYSKDNDSDYGGNIDGVPQGMTGEQAKTFYWKTVPFGF